MGKPVEVSEITFDDQVLKSGQPVLVDFWAPWCAPCRRLAPIVEELAQEYEGRVTFTKLNTDESPNVAARYGIMSIPTIMVFKNGHPVKQVVGLRPKKDLKQQLDEALVV
ncbi:MAG: thioredoxin [Chloroflexi bacterium]|nr:thioredoxin [Chloroflexota bacterium]